MVRILTVSLLALFLVWPSAAKNNERITSTLEEIYAKASKVKFEAAEVAAHLRKRDSNLAALDSRLQLLEENAEALKKLVNELEQAAADQPAAQTDVQRLKQAVQEVNENVDYKADVLSKAFAEKHRKQLRERAEETAKLSESVRQMAARMGS
jgi:trans-aconitate methyltransferase